MTKRAARDPYREAAQWIDPAHSSATDEQDKAIFDAKIASDPAFREAFADLSGIWHSGALLKACSEFELTERRRSWLGHLLLSVTAVVACVLVAMFVPIFELRTIVVPKGEEQRYDLADGTTVWLGGGAQLAVRQGLLFRSAELKQGDGTFDVAHQAFAPFTVDAGATRARVMGTRFHLDQLRSGRVTMAVYRGVVAFGDRSQAELLLRQGDGATRDGNGIQRERGSAEGADRNWLELRTAPLSDLVDQLDRRSKISIVSKDDATGRTVISGRFNLADRERTLRLMAMAYDVKIVRVKNFIGIYAQPKK